MKFFVWFLLKPLILWMKGPIVQKSLGRLRMILCYWKAFSVPNDWGPQKEELGEVLAEKVLKGWQRVSLHPPTVQSRNACSEELVCDSMSNGRGLITRTSCNGYFCLCWPTPPLHRTNGLSECDFLACIGLDENSECNEPKSSFSQCFSMYALLVRARCSPNPFFYIYLYIDR